MPFRFNPFTKKLDVVDITATPPSVVDSVTTQSGTATPIANEILETAYGYSGNNINGIITKGGTAAGNPPGAGAGNEVTHYLTNRSTGSATTNDAVTGQILCAINLGTLNGIGAVAGTFLFRTFIVAYNVTSQLSAVYAFQTGIRTTGAAATQISSGNLLLSEEGAMTAVDVLKTYAANTFTITVTGYNTDIINWSCLNEYIYIG